MIKIQVIDYWQFVLATKIQMYSLYLTYLVPMGAPDYEESQLYVQ